MIQRLQRLAPMVAMLVATGALPATAFASEADLVIPNLHAAKFLGGAIDGWQLLFGGFLVCLLGLGFGGVMFVRVRNLPVHESMREISELIFETCKTYLITQVRFIAILELLIGAIIVAYFGFINPLKSGFLGVGVVLLASVVGILGSVRRRLVRHPHQHVRQQPLGLRVADGQALPDLRHPAEGRHVDRHAAHLGRARPDARDPAVRAR
jgi:K(+)-stimulated pyrophosphate-energized sodium pump